MTHFLIEYTETRVYRDEIRIVAKDEADARAQFDAMAAANELEPDVLEETSTEIDAITPEMGR